MAFEPTNILQIIILAVSGWTLNSVIQIKEQMSVHKTKLQTLPCSDCPKENL